MFIHQRLRTGLSKSLLWQFEFTALSNAAKKVYECYCKGDTPRILLITPIFLLYATLAPPFNNLSSALAGAATIVQAQADPFKASGAAAAFWSFSAAGKGLGPAAMSG